MTKDVVVTISGFHMDEEEGDTIEMVYIGEYHERKGVHYVFYEERLEGVADPVKNRITVTEQKIELQKRGPVTVNMVFEEQKHQSSTYAIPYGSFLMDTYTTKVEVKTEEDCLGATASYELHVNGVRCASCDVRVFVQSRDTFQLMERGKDDGEE